MLVIEIRPEETTDFESIYRINDAAFGRPDEARLVERLRNSESYIALVSVENNVVNGHIFFTRVTLSPENSAFNAVGLAPMAVLRQKQNNGIGSMLVRAGLEECRRRGFNMCVVLGHPQYYPRFGFRPARNLGLTCEYDVPDEAFMAIELVEFAASGIGGLVRYSPAFAEL